MKLLKVQRQFKRKESSEFPIFYKEEQGYPVATQVLPHGQGRMTLMGKKRRPRKPKDFEGGVQEVGLRKDCVKERK